MSLTADESARLAALRAKREWTRDDVLEALDHIKADPPVAFAPPARLLTRAVTEPEAAPFRAGVPASEVSPSPPVASGILGVVFTLTALILGPIALVYVAGALIAVLTALPLLVIGTFLFLGGFLAYSLCQAAGEPWYIADGDKPVISSLFESRIDR